MKIKINSHKVWQEVFAFSTVLFFIFNIAQAIYPFGAWADFEGPSIFHAKSILKPNLLKGEHHRVSDSVKNDGFYNHYTVESVYGVFSVISTRSLETLIHELEAIAAMKEVQTDDTMAASVKKSGENTLSGIKNLINEPKATMEGAAAGVNSLFHRAKETVGKRKVTDAEDSKFEQIVGISKAKGEIASQYGVNVYSTNKVLQEELDRLGRADYLGGLGVGVASSFVPGVGGLVLSVSGGARLLNDVINTTPASELWLQNKNKLIAMGLDADTVELFLNNPVFSPAKQTILVAALESMKGVLNRDLFIKVALQAANSEMAETITNTAVMFAGYHKQVGHIKRLSPMARLVRGETKDGSVIVLLPTDHIIWSEKVSDTAAHLTEEAKGADIELWTIGAVSQRASKELEKVGWKIQNDVLHRLIPRK